VHTSAALDLALTRGLPRREAEVLVLLAVGAGIDASAEILGLSAASVKRARSAAYRHLGAAGADALRCLAMVSNSRLPLATRSRTLRN
jgi:DNA-binding NarL/FixJ family response regulator